MNKRICGAIASLGLVMAMGAEEAEYSTLPEAVQTAVQQNLGGGGVASIEQQFLNGRTVYEVEIARDGGNREIWVDADGTVIAKPDSAGGAGVFQKGDGKILGIPTGTAENENEVEAIAVVEDAGGAFKAETEVELEDAPRAEGTVADDDGADVLPTTGAIGARTEIEAEDRKADIEADRERNRRLQAKAQADTDPGADDPQVTTDANRGEGKGIFRKGDGKILGVPVPGRAAQRQPEVVVEAGRNDSHNRVTTDASGGLDTDKGDGRILGVPKRGFETLPMSKVPEPVRQTIRREARGNRIAEIELATKDGASVYEVDIEKDGLNRELHVAADGRILKDSENEGVGGAPGSEKGVQADR